MGFSVRYFTDEIQDMPKNRAQKDPLTISHHIHRSGHHFENHIVEQACQLYGHRNSVRQGTRSHTESVLQSSMLGKRLEQQGKRLGLQNNKGTSEQLHRQVGETIRELFPDMPQNDLVEIVERAFQKVSVSSSLAVGMVSTQLT